VKYLEILTIKQNYTLHYQIHLVIDTVRVFLPKCPLTTVRSRFSADELQIVWGEAEGHHGVVVCRLFKW